MVDSPRYDKEGDKYVVRLERTCPKCQKEVVKHYDRETLRNIAGHMPVTECPHCNEKF